MSCERFAEFLDAVRLAVRDFLMVAVEFVENVLPVLKYRGGGASGVIERLKLWKEVMRETLLLAENYIQVVYEALVFMSRLTSLFEGSQAQDERPTHLTLKVDAESAKLFLRKLVEEGFLRFDEQVNVVWGRMLRLSSIVAPLDEEISARLKRLVGEEIRRWVGEGSSVMDAYNRALEADCEEELTKEILNFSSGPRLLLDGLKRIALAFNMNPDPTSLPLDRLSEIMKVVKEAVPNILRGIEARFSIHSYWVNTLFHMLRVLHGSDRKAFMLLDQLIDEAAQSRGRKVIQELLPKDVNLEELRAGLVIARTNLEDSLRELPYFKLMVEKFFTLLNLINIPIIRDFCEKEHELVRHAESSINQALRLAKDANFKAYRAMEELKRLNSGAR
ncbi:MAG: hypothetical protein QXW47_09425 [Candidatus Jordarchaeales archaeon]|nr:hypothetical protein [Candidatus Jordarchaeia archaeon]